MARLGGEQRVQRIDADRRRAKPPRGACQPTQIGEIADPPIARAAQSVELRCQTPIAPARLQRLGQVTRRRRDDQLYLCRHAPGLHSQLVIAERQCRGQVKGRRVAPSGHSRAVLETAVPFDGVAAIGETERHRRIGGLLRDDLHRRKTKGRRGVLRGEPIGGLFGVGGQAESADQRGERVLARLMPDAERIDMAQLNADQTGDMAQFVEPAHRGIRR